MQNFNEIGLSRPLVDHINKIGFHTPTPIQAQSIPHVLEGKDLLGSAQTGTGKTGAYSLPMIDHLIKDEHNMALILLPTRELAMQVDKAITDFLPKEYKINSVLLIGGEDMFKQLKKLKSRPRLIIGTPGRVNDHLQRGTLKIDRVNYLVLDEIDRMLDMGFSIQLEEISKYLGSNRQTLMFSATLPKMIEKLATKYLNDPVRVSVSCDRPAAKIKQENITLLNADKYPKLLEELNNRQGSILVFVNTKSMADKMSLKLRDDGHKVDFLHGDLKQGRRNKVVTNFRKQKYRILVATDVAARGLDIPHIEHVVNYDLPQCPEDYIHRIGRTARAGAEGEAINFLSPEDNMKWRAIEKLLDPTKKPMALLKEAPRKGRRRDKIMNTKSNSANNSSNNKFGKSKFSKNSKEGRSSFNKGSGNFESKGSSSFNSKGKSNFENKGSSNFNSRGKSNFESKGGSSFNSKGNGNFKFASAKKSRPARFNKAS